MALTAITGLELQSKATETAKAGVYSFEAKLLTTKAPLFPQVYFSASLAGHKDILALEPGDKVLVVGHLRTLQGEKPEDKKQVILAIQIAPANKIEAINLALGFGALGRIGNVNKVASNVTTRRAIITADAMSAVDNIMYPNEDLDPETELPKELLESSSVFLANVWGEEEVNEFNALKPGSPVEIQGLIHGSVGKKDNGRYMNIEAKRIYGLPIGNQDAILGSGDEKRISQKSADFSVDAMLD